MPTHAVLVGIGGTGAKCVEAAVHLAASGHTPENLYPILIDQDRQNGNVLRCKNALQAYRYLQKNSGSQRKWFFKPTIILYDELLPLVPQEESANFGAAIGLPSMSEVERAVVHALFLPSQLNEILDSGYKKRAHMGSLLFEKMLELESKKSSNTVGLKFIIDKIIREEKPHIVIFGSLFGGTGASGIVRIGKFFKNNIQNAIIKGVFLTPYFIIERGSEEIKDSNLVKSDADMQAVKVALEMYKSEIEDSFHYIYIIGSELSQLSGEYVTKAPKYGGAEQENPAHVFELIAAMVINEEPLDNNSKYYTFIVDTEKNEPPLTFTISNKYPSEIETLANLNAEEKLLNKIRLIISKDFAHMLFKVKEHNDSWWRRQPWADKKFKTELVNWAERHYSWWQEMSTEKWNDHCWGKFPLLLNTHIPEYSFSAYLSRYIKSSTELANLFYTVDILGKKKNLRELKWASI